MRAAVVEGVSEILDSGGFLRIVDMPAPTVQDGQVLVEISACGICHTEIDEIEGRTPPKMYPMVPGHQIVGTVVGAGRGAVRHAIGTRVGVGWFYSSCGFCSYCREGRENLCPDFVATGRDVPGGYAEYIAVPETAAFAVPEYLNVYEAAPLLCAGAVGYRAYVLSEISDSGRLGFSGYGASARITLALLREIKPRIEMFVFARNEVQREMALDSGAVWAGRFTDNPPALLDAIIDTTPAWSPVLRSLECIRPGGTLVINAIRKEARDIDSLRGLRYEDHLWQEKRLTTVANVTPADVSSFLALVSQARIPMGVDVYPLKDAAEALYELRVGGSAKAKVIAV